MSSTELNNKGLQVTLSGLTAVRRRLAACSRVLGVGFGLKETAGRLIPQASWRVYVTKKVPKVLVSRRAMIPPVLFGFPTDVVQHEPTHMTAMPRGAAADEGMMIANRRGVPGTLGCWAQHTVTGEAVLLSNYHVLFGKRSLPGDVIWRVCPNQVKNDFEKIGTSRAGKAGTVKFRGCEYFIDAAIGDGSASGAEECASLPPHSRPGSDEAELDSVVSKTGAATQRTFGRVVDICYPDRWHFDLQSANAPNQILIQPELEEKEPKVAPFSREGDSGAVVRNASGQVVGLLWGSNARGEGVACHIGPVLRELCIRLDS